MTTKIHWQLIIVIITVILFEQQILATDFSVSGYVKYMYSFSKPRLNQQTLHDHLLHFRLNNTLYFSNAFMFKLEARWRTFYGQSKKEIPDFDDQVIHHYPLANLGWKLITGQQVLSYLELDRLYFDYQADQWQLTIGRQRIAWGTSLVWNVIDLFNPLSVLDFDYEEHPGADALRFQYFTGSLSHVELVFQPAKSPKKQNMAFLWATHYGEYDFYFLLGRQNQRKTAGLAWAGYIKDAGFRGEMRWSEPLYKSGVLPPPAPQLPSLTENRKDDWQMVLSADYSFPNSFYMHSEVLYNHAGLTQHLAYYQAQLQALNRLSIAKWSLFQQFSYDLHPLVKLDVFALINPNDHSWIAAPSLAWSVTTNLDFYWIAFISQGMSDSEFGAIGKATFVRLKYSF